MARAFEKPPKINAEIAFEKKFQKSLTEFEFGLYSMCCARNAALQGGIKKQKANASVVWCSN